jgi:hypothetical protein
MRKIGIALSRLCVIFTMVFAGQSFSQEIYKVQTQAEVLFLASVLAERLGLDTTQPVGAWLSTMSDEEKRRVNEISASLAAHRRDEAILNEFRDKVSALKAKISKGFCYLTDFRLIDPGSSQTSYSLSIGPAEATFLDKATTGMPRRPIKPVDVMQGFDANTLQVPLQMVSDKNYSLISQAVGSNKSLRPPVPKLQACVQILAAEKGVAGIGRGGPSVSPKLKLQYLSASIVAQDGKVIFAYPAEWMKHTN